MAGLCLGGWKSGITGRDLTGAGGIYGGLGFRDANGDDEGILGSFGNCSGMPKDHNTINDTGTPTMMLAAQAPIDVMISVPTEDEPPE
jgi:hypothetical protein